jgi:hypothetical protein
MQNINIHKNRHDYNMFVFNSMEFGGGRKGKEIEHQQY